MICPLDWGIGHASRCVPVIRKLLERDQNVIIGAAGRPLAFLQMEFPDLKYINFPGYEVRYPAKKHMALKMLLSSPKILNGIHKEHRELKKIIREHHIDLVISDNRYGVWHKNTLSVFMSHQLHIETRNKLLNPLQPLLLAINKLFIKQFDICWVPDFEKPPGLSGKLSHPIPANLKASFLGPLSRFAEMQESKAASNINFDIIVLISGPEPQRSIFENIILNQSSQINAKILILGGKPGENNSNLQNGNIKYLNHLGSDELFHHLKNANLIISRPGYSTVMDLAFLRKKAVFVPTPGQTEQEYLAEIHSEQGHCISYSQEKFSLSECISAVENLKGFQQITENSMLDNQIDKLLK